MLRHARRARLRVASLVLGALVGLAAAVLYFATDRAAPRGHGHAPHAASAKASPTSQPRSEDPQHDGVDPVDLELHLDRMRRLSLPHAAATQPRITGEATTHPDLYAAEFVRRLLTQDYTRPRADHLAWVQAESTTTADPLVIGLVPPGLRDRFAVYSVTDTSDGPAPIPTQREWATLAESRAYTTVRIDRVLEPTAWVNAVRAGRITDPGTTARLVAATVTRRSTIGSHPGAEEFSVAISLNLQGPPTRADWRFVTAVTYTVIPVGGAS